MNTHNTTWKTTTESKFWEMLGCLPPELQKGGAFLVGEPYSHRRCKISGKYADTFQGFREFSTAIFEETSEPVTREEFLDLIK